jgi:signal transduction histidine kinase
MRDSKTKSELTVPIKARGMVLGVLDVQSDQLNAFDASDLSVLQTLAHQAGVAIENATLFEAEQRRADQFGLIHKMGSRMASILELDELLEQMVSLVQEAFDYYLVEIGLVEGDQLVYKSRAGIGWDPPFESFSLKIGDEGITGWVAATGEPVLVPNVDQDPRYKRVTTTDSRSELAVPIKVKDKVTGVINVESDRPARFDSSDLEVLQLISNQAAIAIENARLYEQAQLMAAMEERNRLARDLHDAVTQTLFSASLIAETLPTLWERDHEEGEQLLKELRQLNRGALAEMRTLLMELRPTALVDASLEELLQQLGDAITGRTGMSVSVLVEGHLELPTDVHVALYRIAQEALNNAVKHAEAKEVQVNLRFTFPGDGVSARVELSVIDDGNGFDLSQVQPECLGLGIMQERAKTIGAELAINSEVDVGTEVMVHWKEEDGL